MCALSLDLPRVPSEISYHVKTYHHLTNCMQVIGNLLSRSKVKVKSGCQNLLTSSSHHNTVPIKLHQYLIGIFFNSRTHKLHTADTICCFGASLAPTVNTTAELGRVLAIVKVTSQVNGNAQFSGSGYPKTISAEKMKFGTTDYVVEGNTQPAFGNNRITGGFSPYE